MNSLLVQFFIGLWVLFVPFLGAGQNLVINGDFEMYDYCPSNYMQPDNSFPCPPWSFPTWGTTDYFNSCSNPSVVGVPDNEEGWQIPRSGSGYIGLIVRAIVVVEYREYLQGPLAQPLIAGKWYVVRFYVNLSNTRCGIEQIGAYFSAEPPSLPWGDPSPMSFLTPQVESNGPFLSDTLDWMLIEGCFQAEGGEQYITIGNFHSNADTPIDPNCDWGVGWNLLSYYYLDDLYVGEVEPGALDLDIEDGPLSDCVSVDLEAGVTGVTFVWSTGSQEPDITATESGMYVLTIYDGCEAGVDSVEVIITDAPPVTLDPDITVCIGETVSISLDPDYGEYTWQDGSNDTEYEITSTGTYTVSLDDGCDITSDQIFVYVLEPPPPFSLGGDTLLCSGGVLEYYFDPDLGDFEWQDGSNNNSININQEGYYAVTITNMCGTESAELEVLEITPGAVQLPLNADTLCNGESLAISLNSNAGTYLWQDGSTSPAYDISNTGLYSVTMTDYCGNTADSILITALTTPVFDFGNPLTPCPGDTISLSAISTSGQYSWQDGSTNDSLFISESGLYSLTITNPCGVAQDNVMVDYSDSLATPDVGPDFSLCPGDIATLIAGNQNASYLWQDQSSADTLLVSAAGTYSVMVSNNCFAYTDTVMVEIENDPPSIDLPAALVLCQNETITLEPGINGVDFNWNTGSVDPTLSVSSPGTYSLTVSNACGSDVDTVIIQDGGPLPLVSLGNDTAICTGETLLLVPSGTSVSSWLWSDGSTDPSIVISQQGTISVIASNDCGVVHDTISIDLLDPIPPLNLGVDTALCPGESIIISIVEPGVEIVWSDGGIDQDLQVNSGGTYYATISNTCGISSDTIVVASLPNIPVLDLGADLPLCPGESLIINPAIAGVDYLWQDGSTDTFFLIDQPATINLVITNACGTSSDEILIYSSTEGPDVELGDDVYACAGATVTLTSNISGVDYMWQDGSTGNAFIVTASGTYFLHVSNSCGTDADTVQVEINGLPPTVTLGNDTILCSGNTLNLLASVDPLTSITWQDGSSLSWFIVTQPGMYFVNASNICGQDADTIQIDGASLPLPFDLGPDTILCQGEVLNLVVPVTTDGWYWSDGSNASTYTVTSGGIYALTIKNVCGEARDEIKVEVDEEEFQFPLQDTFYLCPDKPILLDVEQNIPAQYTWSTGSSLPSITITTPGLYTVTVDTRCLEDQHNVVVLPAEYCSSGFYIPNIFSPNLDLVNDVFTILPGTEVEVISMQGIIFDRWGNQLFSSNEIPFTWDGSFKGDVMMPGVYVYSITILYRLGDREFREKFTGDITLVR